MSIPATLRRLVIERSGDRCEYCGLFQAGQVATFHIDHIVPEIAGGATTADNLALACFPVLYAKVPDNCLKIQKQVKLCQSSTLANRFGRNILDGKGLKLLA